WVFASLEDQWQHDTLKGLVERLDSFAEPEHGLLADVEHRLEFARVVDEQSLSGPRASAAWSAAIASIRNPVQCPKYSGLEITPQIGLLPIGRDPRSG